MAQQKKYNRKRSGVLRFNYAGGGSVQDYAAAYIAGTKSLEDIAKETGVSVANIQAAIERAAGKETGKNTQTAKQVLLAQEREQNKALADAENARIAAEQEAAQNTPPASQPNNTSNYNYNPDAPGGGSY